MELRLPRSHFGTKRHISVRKTPAHTSQPASFAAGELLREPSARESCAKTHRREESERLASVTCRAASLLTPSPPGRLRAAPAPLCSPLRGKTLPRAAPQPEPVRLPPPAPARTLRVPSQPGRADRSTAPRDSPQPRPPRLSFPSQLPPTRGWLRAYLRWSKEWMLRAAFPCPPPTQLRERPNMLAANGCYGPRGFRAS